MISLHDFTSSILLQDCADPDPGLRCSLGSPEVLAGSANCGRYFGAGFKLVKIAKDGKLMKRKRRTRTDLSMFKNMLSSEESLHVHVDSLTRLACKKIFQHDLIHWKHYKKLSSKLLIWFWLTSCIYLDQLHDARYSNVPSVLLHSQTWGYHKPHEKYIADCLYFGSDH